MSRERTSRFGEALAPSVFVWIVFAAMLASAFAFVARYSSAMPMADDLEWSEYVDSSAETSAEWWWSLFNEHRIPLPRAFFLALVRSTHDIRSGMYFDVVLLGGVALAMILVVRKLRGRTSYSDAFFPLLFLTSGNAENLLMMHSISLILPSAITCALLLLFAASPDPPAARKSLVIGILLFSLPLCGAPGVTPAPALVLWCGYVGWKLVRSADSRARRSGVILLASAISTVLLLAFYFRGFDNPASALYSTSAWSSLRQALGFLTLGFGPAGREFWPLSGWVTAAVIAISFATLALAFRARPSERARISGLLAIAAGILSMALATGIARGGGYEYAGFAYRYVTLPAPLLCCVYLASCLYGPEAFGRFVRVALSSLLLVVFFANLRAGTAIGSTHARVAAEFCADIEKGRSVRELAVAHWWNFYSPPDAFEAHLESLRKFRFGPMAAARPASNDRHYPMFLTRPMLVSSPESAMGKVGDQTVLLVPADCVMHFSLRGGKQLVTGKFGVAPPAAGDAKSAEVRFTVELRMMSFPTRILFERVLAPAEREGDRGLQSFSATIPEGSEGEILLRTSPGLVNADPEAQGCWTHVEIR